MSQLSEAKPPSVSLLEPSTPMVPHTWGKKEGDLRDTLKLPAAFRCT